MIKLIAKLHGQEVGGLILEDGQTYVVGRGTDCALVLQEQKGISRQHFKLMQHDGKWHAESLSRFVPLQMDGEGQGSLELKEGSTFFAPPFEFRLASEAEKAAESGLANTASGANVGNLDATVVGAAQLIPHMRILYTLTQQQDVLRLEGDLWIAGRESAAEITLRDSRVSRQHFEFSRTREGFFITDLGSSNGTNLNGQRLPAHEPTKVESGDHIKVLDIELTFEIRDPDLANRLQKMPQATFATSGDPGWYLALPPGPGNNLPAVDDPNLREMTQNRSKRLRLGKIDFKKHKIRIALLAAVPILLVGLLQGKEDPARNPAGKKSEPASFENLSPEQRAAVKDTFNLSRNLYVSGKYELCLAELAKLHDMIPQYENSRELKEFCEQGRELKQRQEDIDRRDRERAQLETQITAVIDGCKAKLRNKGTVDQVRQCLAEAIEMNPDHPSVIEMLGAAQAREDEEKLLEKERASRHERTRKGEAMYNKAKNEYKKGHLAVAVDDYNHFLSMVFPDLDMTQANARREVASIKKELEKKVSYYTDQCKNLGDKSKFKEAYLACDQAIKEDPHNEQAVSMRSHMLSNLRRDIKSVYEDSVLEESLGNVDSAKEKWKKIINDDLDFDEYSKKAKILLRKYGVEM